MDGESMGLRLLPCQRQRHEGARGLNEGFRQPGAEQPGDVALTLQQIRQADLVEEMPHPVLQRLPQRPQHAAQPVLFLSRDLPTSSTRWMVSCPSYCINLYFLVNVLTGPAAIF